jgi:replicative DNA helicase
MAELTSRRGIDLAAEGPSPEGRIPPQAVDIEEQILGAMLLDKEAIARVVEVVDDSAFHAERNRKIFQAIIRLFDKGEPADSITVAEELRRKGELDRVGGEAYLVELTMKVSSTANVEYHARIILEKALMRNLIVESGRISTRAYSQTEDAFDLLDEAEQAIFRISQARMKRNFVSMDKAVHDTL